MTGPNGLRPRPSGDEMFVFFVLGDDRPGDLMTNIIEDLEKATGRKRPFVVFFIGSDAC